MGGASLMHAMPKFRQACIDSKWSALVVLSPYLCLHHAGTSATLLVLESPALSQVGCMMER